MASNVSYLNRYTDLATQIVDNGAIEIADGIDESELGGLRCLERVALGFRRAQGTVAAPANNASPSKFGPLDVHEQIGDGSQGIVYRARDPLIRQDYALKIRATNSDVRARQFLDEASKLATLRHQNILTVYGAAIDGGRVGIWTELVRGLTLAQLQESGFQFPIEDVRAIGQTLCDALAAAHHQGMVHGDVKAANVMRDDTGRIVLMDFGAAQYFRRRDQLVSSMGTLRYLAPEILLGDNQSPQSDVYALGVLLYFLLTGEFPYAGDTFQALVVAHRFGGPKKAKQSSKRIPADLAKAIDKALQEDLQKFSIANVG
jgi:serine/threonine protein kinase